jgi:hypothetical protein
MKVAPGAEIGSKSSRPGAAGSRSVLGVLADKKSGTLYVRSNDMAGIGVRGPTDIKGALSENLRSPHRRTERQFCIRRCEVDVQRNRRRR